MYGNVQPGTGVAGKRRANLAACSETHVWNSCPSRFEMVALVASAGGLPAFCAVLRKIPADYPAPILILQHRASRLSKDDCLVAALDRCSKVEVASAEHGMQLRAGAAYVAPPGRHLLVSENSRIVVRDSPPLNYNRPSADMLFASLAAQFDSRLMVAVLSGSGKDGAVGAVMVKAAGGTVLVQDPFSAACAGMPEAAIATGCVDLILPIDRMGDALTTLTMVPGATDLFCRSMGRCLASRLPACISRGDVYAAS